MFIKARPNIVVKMCFAVTMFFLIVMFLDLKVRISEVQKRKEELNSQIIELSDSVKEIEYWLNLPFDDKYIEHVARTKLNYNLPGDIVFFNNFTDENK